MVDQMKVLSNQSEMCIILKQCAVYRGSISRHEYSKLIMPPKELYGNISVKT